MKTVPFSIEEIKRIAADYPTPFHIYDAKGIRQTIRALYEAFSWNKGFREYFAVKAAPNPVLIQLLLEEGAGVDCSSYTELMLADALSLSGEDIMFSSNNTPAAEFRYARALDAIINLDDFNHIDFLRDHGGIPEEVSLRFNPGGQFSIGTKIMGNPGEAKYGFTRRQLTEGLLKLKTYGVRSFGLHAFLASNSTDTAYYPALAALLFQTSLELYHETGVAPRFVNLSGGIGIPYRPEEERVDIASIGRQVKKAYDDILSGTGIALEIKTELGRYVTGPHGFLVTTVLHEKNTYKHYLGVDACAAHLMRPAIYGAYHHITILGKEHLPYDKLYDVTGSLCENSDKFAIDRLLPHADIGDIAVIHDTGAHGHAMGYNYNGKLRSAELLLLEDRSVRLIRRAETPADYFATLDVTGLSFKEPQL